MHVHRVASWIGMILKGIERSGAEKINFNRTRQLTFEYRGKKFKVRYNHQIRRRGGIEIVEILPGRGTPDGEVVFQARNIRDAEDIYLGLGRLLDQVLDR